MAKLTDKQKKKIVADYIECNNYSEVARTNDVSVNTVKNIVLADEETANKCKLKKEENIQSTIEYMQTQHETKKQILDKILKAINEKCENIDMFTNIKDLATAYGILVDKELKVLELQRNSEGIENSINNHIMNIADLINNPQDNRGEKDVQ